VRIVFNVRKFVKEVLPGHLPDFLIVGAQKAATSSLYYYLSQHPNIIGSRPKEVCFFDRDENYSKGINWYRKNFPKTKITKEAKYFEATPAYIYRSFAAERIYNFNPKIKIIVILRDPVERAFSAWKMYKHISTIKRPNVIQNGYVKELGNNILREYYNYPTGFPAFEKAIDDDINKFKEFSEFEEPSIVRRGIYYPQLRRYMELFGSENILIIGFKDLVAKNKIGELNRVLNFINLPVSNWKFLCDEPKNTSRIKESLSDTASEKLRSFFEPHNNDLFEYIGYQPNW
jgi:hypothetical protein